METTSLVAPPAAGPAGEPPFHVVSVGWDRQLVTEIWDRVERRTGYRFSHVVLTPRHRQAFEPGRGGGIDPVGA